MSSLPLEPAPQVDTPTGFLRNVNLVFITTVMVYGLAFITAVLLARALGPSDRGIAALYQAAVSLGFAFFSLGLASAVVYFVARREVTPRLAMETGLSVTVAATLVTAIAVGVAALLWDHAIVSRGVPYWLAIVAVPAVIQYRCVEGVLRAQGRFGRMNALEILLPLSVLVALGGVELTSRLTVHRAVVAWSLAFLPPVAFGYALLGVDAWPRRFAGPAILRRVLGFGVQGQLSNLLQLLNYRLDSYLVLAFVNSAGVGLYAVSVTLSEGMWFIANSVTVVFLTNITSSDETYRARMTPLVCRNTLFVTAAGAIAAGAVSPFVIPAVFGKAFADAVPAFLWLLPGTVALAGAKVLAAYVFSRGKPLLNAWIALATLVVTVAVDVVLIPAFGVTGAAAGASFAYILSLVLTALAYRSLSGASIFDAIVPRPADATYYIEALRSLTGRVALGRGAARIENP
jgi:O-antigen/teichoic acid export membrane protein